MKMQFISYLKTSEKIIIGGAVVVFFILLFPSWQNVRPSGRVFDLGYNFIFYPPRSEFHVFIDWSRVLIKILAAVCITFVGWFVQIRRERD